MSDRSLTDDEIQNRVTYHPPSEKGRGTHAQLSHVFAVLMQNIDELVPAGREKSLVFTKLEEAKMWASAGVARNPETR